MPGCAAGARAIASQEAALTRKDVPWLAGAIVAGGVVGPVLLMWGLAQDARLQRVVAVESGRGAHGAAGVVRLPGELRQRALRSAWG